MTFMQKIVKISDNPDIGTLNNLVDLVNKNDLSTANKEVKNLTKKYPSSDVLHNISGLIAEKFNNFENAIYHYKSAIKIRPENVDSHFNLGNIYFQSKNYLQAISSFENCLKIDDRIAKAHNNIGLVFIERGKDYQELAINSFKKAIQIDPNFSQSYNNLSAILFKIGKYDEAIFYGKKALELNPCYAQAANNIGNACYEKGLTEKAYKYFKKSIQISPNYPDANWNLSLYYLAKGNFQRGWELFDSRWKTSIFKGQKIEFDKPVWSPSLKSKILIWNEQGIGDEIQFSSVLNEVKKDCEQMHVVADKRLINLFNRSFSDINFIKNDEINTINYDFQIPIASLLKFYRKNKSDFVKNQRKFILSDEYLKNEIRSLISSKSSKILCGLSWLTTNPSNFFKRNLDIVKFFQFLPRDKFSFINLQYGISNNDLIELRNNYGIEIFNFSQINLFQNIDAQAALIDACDVVVSIANSVAHLSSSLNKNTKVILPKVCDWRWGLNGEKSFWYKNTKLYRQKDLSDWDYVYKKISDDLKKL